MLLRFIHKLQKTKDLSEHQICLRLRMLENVCSKAKHVHFIINGDQTFSSYTKVTKLGPWQTGGLPVLVLGDLGCNSVLKGHRHIAMREWRNERLRKLQYG